MSTWLNKQHEVRDNLEQIKRQLNRKAFSFEDTGNMAMAEWLKDLAMDIGILQVTLNDSINQKLGGDSEESMRGVANIFNALCEKAGIE